MSTRVLIVDDEPDVVKYLSAVLQSHDYEVHTASSAAAALEALGHIRPDLICLDIMMPEESGLSLYVRLRREKATRETPVMVISGLESEEDFNVRNYVDDTEVPAPDHYLEKPIRVDAFVEAVARLTETTGTGRSGQREESSS